MKSRSPQFDLEKQISRDDKAYHVNMTPSQAPPDIAKKLMFEEISLVTFDKQSPRKGIVNYKSINWNSSVIPENVWKAQWKKITTPVFDKLLHRAGSESALPSFMEGIHNRLTVGCLNSKMLEMNNFDSGRF